MPPTEILRLLDMVIFNVLACNTDSHAKNYSIMIRGNGVSLAPAYDVMCGEVWENVTKNFWFIKSVTATEANNLWQSPGGNLLANAGSIRGKFLTASML
jgi:HipA-like C-terminal domain